MERLTHKLAFLLICSQLISCGHMAVNSSDAAQWFDAVKRDDLTLVKSMVENKKIDVNLQDKDGATALHYALGRSNIALAKWLIERGADIRKKNSYGATPLDYSRSSHRRAFSQLCIYGNKQSVEIFLKHRFSGINDAYCSETPLMCAAQFGNLEVVKYLVEAGADINIKSTREPPYDRIALDYAFMGGEPEIYMYLLETMYNRPDSKKLLPQEIIDVLEKIDANKALSEDERRREIKGFVAKTMVKYEHSSPKTMEWLKESAENGDPEAQYLLGISYKRGRGVKRNYKDAVKWLRKSFGQGYQQAEKPIGECYRDATIYDKENGLKWLREAAEQGDLKAQYRLAFECYCENDIKEAIKYYTKAARQGHVRSQYMLGNLYHVGKRVKRDPVEAVKWYKKAIDSTKDEELKKRLEKYVKELQDTPSSGAK